MTTEERLNALIEELMTLLPLFLAHLEAVLPQERFEAKEALINELEKLQKKVWSL